MERDEMINDDFLKRLVGSVPLDHPSDGFTSKVMAGILVHPELVKANKPFYLYLKSILPWVLLGLFLIVFLFSSDIPYLSFLPGKAFFSDHFTPYFTSLFSGMSSLFTGSKTLSITLALMASVGGLAGIDWLLRRRSVARHHAA